MKENRLTISINKQLHDVFLFCITPPNSTKWIPDIIHEETSEWPVKVGTIYTLTNNKGEMSRVIISQIVNDEMIEWVSEDGNYHCRYTFKSFEPNITKLQYNEWVDKGEIDGPFSVEILDKLKEVLENENVN